MNDNDDDDNTVSQVGKKMLVEMHVLSTIPEEGNASHKTNKHSLPGQSPPPKYKRKCNST